MIGKPREIRTFYPSHINVIKISTFSISLSIFSDTNNIAKLVLDIWGNCTTYCTIGPKWTWFSKAAVGKCFTNYVFLKFSENSHEKNLRSVTVKERLQRRCFPANFAKFLRTHFLQNTSGRLLLDSFHTFYRFFPTQWTNRNYIFTIFELVNSRVSNVMNITNFAIGKLYFA